MAARPKTPKRQRRTPEARVEEILAVSLDLFAKRDFGSVTIRDIAREVGVNVALIYYYFESKEELFRSTIEHAIRQALDRYEGLADATTSPIDALNAWFDVNVQLSRPLRTMAKIIIDYRFSGSRFRSIDRLIGKLYEDELTILSRSVGEGVRQGLFRPVDPQRLALFVSTHLDGVFFAAMTRRNVDLDARMQNLREILWDYLAARSAESRSEARPRHHLNPSPRRKRL